MFSLADFFILRHENSNKCNNICLISVFAVYLFFKVKLIITELLIIFTEWFVFTPEDVPQVKGGGVTALTSDLQYERGGVKQALERRDKNKTTYIKARHNHNHNHNQYTHTHTHSYDSFL